MDAFLAVWLDELSAMDALRLCAASRSAREALGADGVAAAAFAVTRPWTASCLPNPAGSLRLWRKAWEACSIASSAFQMRGGAWLKTATVIPALPVNQDPRETDVGLTLDVASARALGEDGVRMLRRGLATSSLARKVIAILLISAKDATFDACFLDDATCEVELQMLVLFENNSERNPCWFGAVIPHANPHAPDVQLTANPLDCCDTVVADGIDKHLLVVQKKACRRCRLLDSTGDPCTGGLQRCPRWCPQRQRVCLCLQRLSSDMKRQAQDGEAYDLFEFKLWFDGGGRRRRRTIDFEFTSLANRRWREAPPLAEVPSVLEIALVGMLTRSALGMLTGRMLTR